MRYLRLIDYLILFQKKKNNISRDVVFEEDRQWSWEDDGHKQAVLADLEWETDEEEGMEGESNEEEFVADEESREIVGASDQNGGDTSHGENSPCVGRARRPPV